MGTSRPETTEGPGTLVLQQSDLVKTEEGFVYRDLNKNGKLDIYEDRRQPIEARVEDLLRQMGTGLLVTEVMGQGVNLVTGDYSRGAGGYWVERGEIQYPVDEVTIAGNLRDMFMQVEAVGADVDDRSNIRTGSVLVANLTVAGD